MRGGTYSRQATGQVIEPVNKSGAARVERAVDLGELVRLTTVSPSRVWVLDGWLRPSDELAPMIWRVLGKIV